MVEFCAPARAGCEVLQLGRKLAPFGLALWIMSTCPKTGASLIYLYRAAWLRRVLSAEPVRAFLERMGYTAGRSCAALLEQLHRRLSLGREFPHEIGVFLGYPLEDVVGFIENHGQNYTCCGCWKAYGNPMAAEALFDSCRRCTAACRKRYQNGSTITQLIAA